MAEKGPVLEHVLIGGAKDGERVRFEAEREYIAFPVLPSGTVLARPVPIEADLRTEKAIYTRRFVMLADRFAPIVYFAAIELTDREALGLLISRYRGE